VSDSTVHSYSLGHSDDDASDCDTGVMNESNYKDVDGDDDAEMCVSETDDDADDEGVRNFLTINQSPWAVKREDFVILTELSCFWTCIADRCVIALTLRQLSYH